MNGMDAEPTADDVLYHYCGNDTFVSIFNNNKNEIWLSDLSLSNDSQEGKWVRKVFAEYCRKKDLAQSDIDLLLKELDFLEEVSGAVGFCLSEKEDSLSQWRAYADDGRGMAIGFDKRYLEGIATDEASSQRSLRLNKVIYDQTEQKESVSPYVDAIISSDDLGKPSYFYDKYLIARQEDGVSIRGCSIARFMLSIIPLTSVLYVLKNPAFHEEAEWRLSAIFFRESSKGVPEDLIKLNYRSARNRIIPYRSLELVQREHPPIKRVILGPRNITPIPVIKGFLAKHGHTAVEVVTSAASYR